MKTKRLSASDARAVPAAARRKGEGKAPGARPSGPSRREPPAAYPAGSQEEQWSLEIVGKGRVTCPTCRAAGRKTVEGLKKHMANCHQGMFTCNHCGKRLRSQAGMKYHIMADHSDLLNRKEEGGQEEPNERDRLRMVLKRMGKLKCIRQGCTGSFTSVLGYLYHTQKCGKADSELEEMLLNCHHCSKAYRSKAGLVYHLKSEHGPVTLLPDDGQSPLPEDTATESSSGRRVQRRSAKVAAYYLHELASAELVKEWPKRKVLQDLVPDDRKLKYTRPGLPAVSQEDLGKWRSEIKMSRRLRCPNQGCESVYSSISGLRSHLGSCTLGGFALGKYKCLLCSREFVSESGVKYHIQSVHAEDWFDVNPTPARRFEALMTLRQKEPSHQHLPPRKCRKQLRPVVRKKLTRLAAEQGSAVEDSRAALRRKKRGERQPAAGQGRHPGEQKGQGGNRLGGVRKKVQ